MAVDPSNKVALLVLQPCHGDDEDQITCKTGLFNRGEEPGFTVLYGPHYSEHLGEIQISLDDSCKEVSIPLGLALKRLRCNHDTRYILLENVSDTDNIFNSPHDRPEETFHRAQFYAFWSGQTRTKSSVGDCMNHFYVILPKHKQEFLSSTRVDDRGITMLLLLPAVDEADEVEIKTVTIPADYPPEHSLLTPCHNYEHDIKTKVMKDGAPIMISKDLADALRLLRYSLIIRYVISEPFQRDAKQIARFQFELTKPAAEFAFWRYPESCGFTEPSPNNMDHFIILPNRYRDTKKFYTTLDYSPESQHIRLLVLPPTHNKKDSVLRCRFQNVSLDDPSRPSYELFQIAGPAKPRNGREELYKYDVEINGYISVVSDGIRMGLLELQHETEERFIYNREVCYNCRDATEVQHFGQLDLQILRGATAGNVLLYDFLSSMTPVMNRNRKFQHPPINRDIPELRLLEFLPSKKDELNCRLIVADLDDFPSFKSLSYTWGSARSMIIHRTTLGPEDNLEEWPNCKNSSSNARTLQTFHGLTEDITINESQFNITKHLGSALRCLRDRGESQYFWVDAICINQSDPADRSSQVQMMGRIYNSAQQVLAYLGDSDKEADALKMINIIGSEDFDWEEFSTWHQYFSESEKGVKDLGSQANDDSVPEATNYRKIFSTIQDPAFSAAMDNFVSLEWWRRLWVYQEATLPYSLILHRGSSRVDFENLFRAVTALLTATRMGLFKTNPLDGANGHYASLMAVRLERRRRHTPGIEAWYGPVPNQFLFYLEALGSRAASDPRDIVYAAMGLTDTYPMKIVPDYSLDVEDVWLSAAKEVIKRDQELTVLSLCEGVMKNAAEWAEYRFNISDPSIKKGQDPLPTWAPFWGQHREGMGAKRLRHDWLSVPEFRACGEYATAGAKFSKDGRILFAKGILIDVVKEVVPGYQRPIRYDTPAETDEQGDQKSVSLNYKAWHDTFRQWEQAVIRVAPHSPDYVLGGTKVDALMYSLHAPFLLEHIVRMNQDDIDLNGALPELYEDKQGISDSQTQSTNNAEPSALATRLWERQTKPDNAGILTMTSGHELAVTEKGYIGIGLPKSGDFGGILAGDLVVVLAGGSVPFFLRQVGSRDRYMLTGDAYMHGLMYGAAMQGVRDGDFKKFPII